MTVEESRADADTDGIPAELRDRARRERETALRLAAYLCEHHPSGTAD